MRCCWWYSCFDDTHPCQRRDWVWNKVDSTVLQNVREVESGTENGVRDVAGGPAKSFS